MINIINSNDDSNDSTSRGNGDSRHDKWDAKRSRTYPFFESETAFESPRRTAKRKLISYKASFNWSRSIRLSAGTQDRRNRVSPTKCSRGNDR